jgi:glucosylceramidase
MRYQSIVGMGTSLEESTIYNLSKMTAAKRDEILTKLVDPVNGAGMNLMRITFGSPDFTAQTFYSYDDMPAGQTDPTLSKFSIQKDIDYNIIATIKRALELNPNLKIFASSWSAPGWMKTSDSLVRGVIKTEYLDELATYYRMSVQAYEAQGIPIYSMTMQNEPLLEIDYPSMYMSPDQQRQFSILLKNELNAYNLNTKLWIFDHNFSDGWYYVPPILNDAAANAAVDGVAFHDYSGSPYTMTEIHNAYPTKKVMLSERSLWGTYGMDRIAQFFRNWAISYNAWVTMLDSNIQPEQWVGTPDPILLIRDASNVNNYWITPEYYMTGQFSKFIQRDAKRISSNYGSTNAVTNVSFLNPDNTIVTVVINQSTYDQTFKIVEGIEGAKEIIATLPAKTVATYKWTRLTGSSPAPTPEPTPTPTPTPTNLLTNPGFETGNTNGWGEWHGGPLAQKVDTDNPHSGSYKLVHWASSAYTQLTYQSLGVTNGTYKASVWVRSGGGQNALHLYVKNYGSSELQAKVGSNPVSGWTQYIIDNINVTSGTIEIGVWSDANGNNWAVFDDLELVKK